MKEEKPKAKIKELEADIYIKDERNAELSGMCEATCESESELESKLEAREQDLKEVKAIAIEAVLEYVEQLERRVKLKDSNYDALAKVCDVWEQACYKLSEKLAAAEAKIKPFEKWGDDTMQELVNSLAEKEKQLAECKAENEKLKAGHAILNSVLTDDVKYIDDLKVKNRKLTRKLEKAKAQRDLAEEAKLSLHGIFDRELIAEVIAVNDKELAQIAETPTEAAKRHQELSKVLDAEGGE